MRRHRRFALESVLALCLVAALLFLACGEDRSVDPKAGTRGQIGPAGGSLALEQGELKATLALPAGALAQVTEVTLAPGQLTVLPDGGVAGTAVTLGPENLTLGKPVLLTLSYAKGALPGADTTWLRMVKVGAGNTLGPTKLASHDAASPKLGAWVSGPGVYLLADLQRSSALVKSEKVKVTDMDLLFVVDNSGSMEQEQQNLAKNFPKLLARVDKTLESYRVGVVSTDMGAGTYYQDSHCKLGGDGGKLQSKAMVAGCTPPTDAWIEKKKDGSSNVPGGDLAAAFSCIAQLGTNGCGFEQTLESAYQALSPPANPGFLRANAALGVVFITDEDDCSAADGSLFDPSHQGLNDPLGPLTSFRCFEFGVTCTCPGGTTCDRTTQGVRTNCVAANNKYIQPLSRYAQQLAQLKPAGQVAVAAIAGPVDKVDVGLEGSYPTLKPSCVSSAGYAAPAVRLAELVKSFGSRGSYSSICAADFSPSLDAIGEMMSTKLQLSWCLPYTPADTNPFTKDLESDCLVVGSKAGKIPSCEPGISAPCYSVTSSKACAASGALIEVSNVTPAALGDQVYAVCLTL